MLCPCSRCKDRKDTCSASNIHHNFIFKVNRIFLNCGLICKSSYFVFQHFLVNMVRWVTIEIIIKLVCVIEICFSIFLSIITILIKPFLRITHISTFSWLLCGFTFIF
jgi:hypothetical protein